MGRGCPLLEDPSLRVCHSVSCRVIHTAKEYKPKSLVGSHDLTILGPMRGAWWYDRQSVGVMGIVLSLGMGPVGCGTHPRGGSLLKTEGPHTPPATYHGGLSPPIQFSE